MEKMQNLNILPGELFLTYTTSKHAQIFVLNTKSLSYNVCIFNKYQQCIIVRNSAYAIRNFYDDVLLTQYKRIKIS